MNFNEKLRKNNEKLEATTEPLEGGPDSIAETRDALPARRQRRRRQDMYDCYITQSK